jgi:hypothetical protein
LGKTSRFGYDYTMAEIQDAVESLSGKTADGEKKGKPETKWAVFTAVGSFFLYLFGYLSLRFHLSALGVATDVSVLDERYFFAGAQFLVYLVTAVPIVLLFALPIYFLVWLCRGWLRPRWQSFVSKPERPVIAGVIVSVVLIQFFVRQCLVFMNLLLRNDLPEPQWMQAILLGNGAIQSIYFAGLVAAVFILVGLWLTANRQARRPALFWNGTLTLLLAIQFLMLPVTFGVLIADQDTPRVASLDGKEPLKANEEAWRIWEGKDGTTFFVRTWIKGVATKRLVTLDNKKIEKTEIVEYDRVLKLLF